MTNNFEFVSPDDKILRKPTNKFDFSDPPFDPIEFSKNLVKFMYDNKGIGLAANQLGIPYSIFAMRGEPENFVCFNPKIVVTSEEKITLDEGCLTYPGIYAKIERPRHVRVRFQTPNGDTLTKKFTGMTARIFQHEMTHLEGKVFTEGMSKLKLEILIKKAKKKGFNYTMKDFI